MATLKKADTYHHGDLRAGLIEAVRQLVEEKGPDRFSVSDACRLAGVSTAAPYRHFTDKEEMLIAVSMEGMRRQRAAMQQAVAGLPVGEAETIARMGEAYVAFAQAEPAVFRLMFGLTRTHGTNEEMICEGTLTYGVLLEQMRIRLNQPEVTPLVLVRSLPLWTFVHGLSFLLIDDKLDALKLQTDVPTLIRDNVRRLLAD